MSSPSNDWIAMHDRLPEPGQLVLIRFTSKLSRVRVCYFDNYATWSERHPDEACDLDDSEIAACESGEPWFTESDDANDWWEAKYVECWLPVPSLAGADK